MNSSPSPQLSFTSALALILDDTLGTFHDQQISILNSLVADDRIDWTTELALVEYLNESKHL